MSAYCATTDIQADFKSYTFTTVSTVTLSAVTGFINEASALIDSYVGGRYVVPVTGAQSLVLMSLYCRTLVSERIRGILEVKQATNTDANQNVKQPGLSVAQVLKALVDIQQGASVLVDQPFIVANAGFSSNNVANGVKPFMRRNVRQW